MKKAIVSWSGGKDSCFALQKGIEHNYEPAVLLTALEATGAYSKSNGVPIDILKEQAKKLQLPLYVSNTEWDNYEENLLTALIACKNIYNANFCIFGDIDIDSHRNFDELICHKAGISAYLPLLGMSREYVASEEVKSGIKAKLSVIRKDKLPTELIGRDYDEELVKILRTLDVYLCGENGEFHTMVYDSRLFLEPLNISLNKIMHIHDIYLIAAFTNQ